MTKENKEPFWTIADYVWSRAGEPYMADPSHARVDNYGRTFFWDRLGQAEPGGWEVCSLACEEPKDESDYWAVSYVLHEGKHQIPKTYTIHPQPPFLRHPRYVHVNRIG